MRSESVGAQPHAQTEETGAVREPGEEGLRRPLRSLQNQGRDFMTVVSPLIKRIIFSARGRPMG